VSWIILILAGIFEMVWAVGLKYTEGFSRLMPSIATVGAMIASMLLLGIAVRELPIGTAYAVWTGVGTVGTFIAGMVLLGESTSAFRVLCVCLILAGIIGLKFAEH
jgi:quaternary ammonium compound-resistance protein SugE